LLRRHRIAAGLTQEALAERAGLSVYGIQKLEAGTMRPYRDTAERLVAALWEIAGLDITNAPSENIVELGVIHVPEGRQRRRPTEAAMTQVSRNLIPVHPHFDRWLMQSLVEHSSSDPAREAAAAWLAAYDAALALGVVDAEAAVHADAAYRVAAIGAGLPLTDRRAA
jgi:transcriptional regulator with XRE-family HTH domain